MELLKVSDFDYEINRSLIAQEPSRVRESSRLMVYSTATGAVEHRRFHEIADYLGSSTLVLNDTKVIPARLFGRKKETGGRVEILLLKEIGSGEWECLLKPSSAVRDGAELVFDGSRMLARAAGGGDNGTRVIVFEGECDLLSELERVGYAPLPPYIKRPWGVGSGAWGVDKERYQTVYARRPGAVAAPTAGLHFSRELLSSLAGRGIDTVAITVHVGWGSFRPVREEFVRDHRLHAEYFEIGEEAAKKINRARREGRRIVAVGTTAARALETVADDEGRLEARKGWTELFIYPPYRFKIVENMITNFHLPRSTLLMLVSALVGREKILDLYEIAKREGYRFYSYGDAMLVLNSKHQAPNSK